MMSIGELTMKRLLLTAITLIITAFAINAKTSNDKYPNDTGSLETVNADGETVRVPLENTSVRADISGFIARVNVRQEFVNNFSNAIEAVYVFPLSHDGAVDRMSMRIGTRTINGIIMRRDQARATYEKAKQAGQTAALLDQERPNIFTQSVANILPGERIIIEISYVETLKYDNGAYEFVFPMVVAPRYNPGEQTGNSGGGTYPDTDLVSDASKITPAIAGTRAGHDVSVEVNINAGVPIESIKSQLHAINTQEFGSGNATVRLADSKTIPNKDFILRYAVAGQSIEDAVLAHRDERGGFFTMIIQPPDDMTVEDVTPKEIVFVLDTSGSMGGFPIEKAKEAMKLSIDNLHPRDTFNIITFAGNTNILFDAPVPATRANLETAQEFLSNTRGYGGTEMMKAIKAALEPTDSQEHLRIVCFMTDGQIGNDMAIISEIQKHKNARVFSFGIGNSVNRYLLENMAKEGNGEAEIVTLPEESKAAAERFYKRVRSPILTDISIDWNGMPVVDVYPTKLTDLFTAKPVVINGRYSKAGKGVVKLKGKIAGQYYEREINVDFPEAEEKNDVLTTLWARRKVAELMSTDLAGIQNRKGDKEIEDRITNLGLEFGIMTQFTSFVAVEERSVNTDGTPRRVDVPVENPDGQILARPLRRRTLEEVEAIYKDWNSKDVRYVVTPNEAAQESDESVSDTVTVKGRRESQISFNGGTSGVSSTLSSVSGGGTGGGGGGGKVQAVTKPVASPAPQNSVGSNTATDSAVLIESSASKIDTSISRTMVDALPTGTVFSSLLMLAPNAVPQASGGGFQVDGTSGSENTFVIDGSETANFRKVVSGDSAVKVDDDITASLAKLEKPSIPVKAKWKQENSIVRVEFSVDETGNVVKAKAVSGSKNLMKPSEKAAMDSKFTPPELDGDKMRMNGLLAYKFVDRDNIEITLEEMRLELTPEKRRQLTKKYKLHFWIYALVERLDNGETAASEFESKFVKDDVADVRVILNDGAVDGVKLLEKAGLKVYKSSGTMVYGHIKINKLYELAELDAVRYVSP